MLHFQRRGESDKPPVVFLHGFLGDHHDWDGITETLVNQFCCISMDLPGHGLSPSAAGMRFDDVADAVIRTLDSAGVGTAALVGYSMGGRVALHTALRHGERFTALVMESASAGIAHVREREARLTQDSSLARELEEMGLSTFLRWWYSQPIFGSLANRPDLLGNLLVRRAQQNPHELAHALRAFGQGAQPPRWDDVKQLRMPTLLLAGTDDPKYVVLAKSLYGRMAEHDREDVAARSLEHGLVIVAGCGHNIHLEEPAAFCEHVRTFLGAALALS